MQPKLKRLLQAVAGLLFVLCGVVIVGGLHTELYDRFMPVSFVEVATERTTLIDGLESYQSIEEARAWFAARSITWRVVGDSRLPPDDERPRHDFYSVSIANYSHLDCVGELNVSFFNNRLSSAWFYPVDHAQYLDRLARQEGIRFVADAHRPDVREATVPPYTRVWPYRDYRGRDYVGWADTRLEREERIWIMRYS